MKKIAFLASENYEESVARAESFQDEFLLLAPAFLRLGFQLQKVVWTASPDFSDFAAVIPKGVWDYFDRPQDFELFLGGLKRQESRDLFQTMSGSRLNINLFFCGKITLRAHYGFELLFPFAHV